jgi:hypothetical protein
MGAATVENESPATAEECAAALGSAAENGKGLRIVGAARSSAGEIGPTPRTPSRDSARASAPQAEPW